MNSEKFQGIKFIYRNLLHFYMLTMSFQRSNSDNDPIYNSFKNNKILRNKLNKGGERCVHEKLQDFDEGNGMIHMNAKLINSI